LWASAYIIADKFDIPLIIQGGETVITGHILDLVRACRIYSDWLILQRVTRSENSAYSSSVKRVLITLWRWGVLYFFMAVNLLSWVDFFKRRKPQKAGLGWQPQQDSRRTKLSD
jgi:hypothetical protein